MRILALAMLGIVTFSQCFSMENNVDFDPFCVKSTHVKDDRSEFDQYGIRIKHIHHKGHDYILMMCKRTAQFTVIHDVDCMTCSDEYNIDLSGYQGCVEVKKNGNYIVDSSGRVESV